MQKLNLMLTIFLIARRKIIAYQVSMYQDQAQHRKSVLQNFVLFLASQLIFNFKGELTPQNISNSC